MSKQSPAARAASQNESRHTAVQRYTELREWSHALLDLLVVVGSSSEQSGIDPDAGTLAFVSRLQQDLLRQIDAQVDMLKEGA